MSETDFEAALEDVQHLDGGVHIAARIEQRRSAVEMSRRQQKCREGVNAAVLYRTGQVMRHKRYTLLSTPTCIRCICARVSRV